MKPPQALYQQPIGGGFIQQTRAATNQPTSGVPVTSTGVLFNKGPPSKPNQNPVTTVSARNNDATSKIIPPPVTQASRNQEASQQFKAAPLHLSVTRDSDVSSNEEKNDSSHFRRNELSDFVLDVTSQSTRNQRDDNEKIAENQRQREELVMLFI